MERFDLMILNDAEREEFYLVPISNKFLTFENLDVEVYINCALVSIRKNVKISAKGSELEERKYCWTKDAKFYYIKENKASCSD
jgi:hypothetical protein